MIVQSEDLLYGGFWRRDWFNALIPEYQEKIEIISKELVKKGFTIKVDMPLFNKKEIPSSFSVLIVDKKVILCQSNFTNLNNPLSYFQGIGLDETNNLVHYLAIPGFRPQPIAWWINTFELKPDLFSKEDAKFLDEMTGNELRLYETYFD